MAARKRLLLKNGLIFDGTGAEGSFGSVLIEDDRITSVHAVEDVEDAVTFDCTGLAISPGFIDLHSHSDVQVLEHRTEKLRQGVTTEVVGNCGFSPFPDGQHRELLHEFAGGILGRGGAWGWPSAMGYLQALADAGASDYALPLVGHGSLRVAVCGLRQGPVSELELDQMSGLLADGLAAGCAGFSTGLMYAPGSSAPPEELEHLCRIVAKTGKLYTTHMRSYSEGLLDAIREQIGLAERTGCRLQISHLQAAGRDNWHLQQPALVEIEAARRRGVDIEFDIYPYQCGSTVLTQLLPQWTLDGGTNALLDRLTDPEVNRRIVNEMRSGTTRNWSDVTISSVNMGNAGGGGSADAALDGPSTAPVPRSSVRTTANSDLVGQTVAQIAQAWDCAPEVCALRLLVEESGSVNIISFNQSEGNLQQLITHPLCSVITDGFYVQGKPHPRLHGTYPELLGGLVREKRWLSLTDALHRCTGKPANRLRLADRGLLKPGYKADITIFDPLTVSSHSTYKEPARNPQGIHTVIKNGEMVLDSTRTLL